MRELHLPCFDGKAHSGIEQWVRSDQDFSPANIVVARCSGARAVFDSRI